MAQHSDILYVRREVIPNAKIHKTSRVRIVRTLFSFAPTVIAVPVYASAVGRWNLAELCIVAFIGLCATMVFIWKPKSRKLRWGFRLLLLLGASLSIALLAHPLVQTGFRRVALARRIELQGGSVRCISDPNAAWLLVRWRRQTFLVPSFIAEICGGSEFFETTNVLIKIPADRLDSQVATSGFQVFEVLPKQEPSKDLTNETISCLRMTSNGWVHTIPVSTWTERDLVPFIQRKPSALRWFTLEDGIQAHHVKLLANSNAMFQISKLSSQNIADLQRLPATSKNIRIVDTEWSEALAESVSHLNSIEIEFAKLPSAAVLRKLGAEPRTIVVRERTSDPREFAEQIAQLASIEDLWLTLCFPLDPKEFELLRGSQMRGFSATVSGIDDSHLSVVRSWSRIQELHLHNTSFSDDACGFLVKDLGLRRLTLSSKCVSATATAELSTPSSQVFLAP